MPTRQGVYNTSTDLKWDDPRAQQQAQAIGAILKPDGKLYDIVTGQNIRQEEADARAIEAGVAIDSNRPRAGYLNQVYDRNKAYIDPALQIGATVLGGPAAGAAVGAGLKYGETHDLGKSAIEGVKDYGIGKAIGAVGKLSGVSSVTDKLGQIPGVGAIKNAAGNVGSWWDKNVAQPVQDSGLKLPSLGGLMPGGGQGDGGLDSLLGLAGVANSAYLQDKSNNYAKNALENVQRSYDERGPLRAAGVAGMQAPPRTLPELGAIRKSGANPFAMTGA